LSRHSNEISGEIPEVRGRQLTRSSGLRPDVSRQSRPERSLSRISSRGGRNGYESDAESVVSTRSTRSVRGRQALYVNEDERFRPANLFGYTGLFVGYVDKQITVADLKSRFARYGKVIRAFVNKTAVGSAIICFDDVEAPREAMYRLHRIAVEGFSYHDKQLNLRFACGHNQDRRTYERTHKDIRRKIEKNSNECLDWRATGCEDSSCRKAHLLMCKGIDYQRWMDD
jgi:hypothetical protein